MSDLPAIRQTVLPPPATGRCDLLFLAGEHSGDQHAAALAERLLQRDASLAMCALGGPALADAKVQLLHDLARHSVVGLVEVLRHYGYFRSLLENTVAWIREYRPRLLCLVDYPGFNLRLARRLHQEGLSSKTGGPTRILQYIGPQIWAWKARRRFAMAEYLDALAVIFPFEPACYADTSLPVDFVGHPFAHPAHTPSLAYSPKAPLLLLPGSRHAAVKRIFPTLLRTFEKLHRQRPDLRAHVPYPGQEVHDTLRACLADSHLPAEALKLLPVHQSQPLAASATLTSSGTMSLCCALAGIPGAIVYRANPLTYLAGRTLIRIPYLGIANLILQRPAWPEYIQHEAQPERLCETLLDCLDSPRRAEAAQKDARELASILAAPGSLSPEDWLLHHLKHQH